MNVNKQMPVLTSTLIRKLFLKKFGEKGRKETYVDQSRRPSESRHEVLDAVNVSSVPVTPLLVQFGPCSCFLDHFVYMRDCLRWVSVVWLAHVGYRDPSLISKLKITNVLIWTCHVLIWTTLVYKGDKIHLFINYFSSQRNFLRVENHFMSSLASDKARGCVILLLT